MRTYTQCKIISRSRAGYLIEVCWIPTDFARLGKKIILEKLGGVWEVETIYGTRSEEDSKAGERDFLHQRGVSDI